jgi:polar amino acid transport system permease protein
MNSLSLFFQAFPFLIKGALATLKIALASIGIGFVGGLIVGILNSERFHIQSIKAFLKTFVWIIRGTPLFIQVLIIYYVLPELLGLSLSPFTAGVIALGINSTAYLSEIIRGGIDAIGEGQWEAASTLGLSWKQTVRGIILPQCLRFSLPSITNELTALIKETSILMVIGVAELTKVSKDIVARELNPMAIYLGAALIYLVMTSTVSYLAQYFQKRGQS